VKKPKSIDEITKMIKKLQIRQLAAQLRLHEELALMTDAFKMEKPSPYYLTWQYRNREYLSQTVWNRIRGCFWDGGNHWKEDCKDLRKAVE